MELNNLVCYTLMELHLACIHGLINKRYVMVCISIQFSTLTRSVVQALVSRMEADSSSEKDHLYNVHVFKILGQCRNFK